MRVLVVLIGFCVLCLCGCGGGTATPPPDDQYTADFTFDNILDEVELDASLSSWPDGRLPDEDNDNGCYWMVDNERVDEPYQDYVVLVHLTEGPHSVSLFIGVVVNEVLEVEATCTRTIDINY